MTPRLQSTVAACAAAIGNSSSESRPSPLAALAAITSAPCVTPTEVWASWVEGRIALVDRFDRDGQRFVVFRRNDVGRGFALTRRERQVVERVALGESSKCVALELGRAPSTVSSHLESGMVKLGVASKVELVRLYVIILGGCASEPGPGRDVRDGPIAGDRIQR